MGFLTHPAKKGQKTRSRWFVRAVSSLHHERFHLLSLLCRSYFLDHKSNRCDNLQNLANTGKQKKGDIINANGQADFLPHCSAHTLKHPPSPRPPLGVCTCAPRTTQPSAFAASHATMMAEPGRELNFVPVPLSPCDVIFLTKIVDTGNGKRCCCLGKQSGSSSDD